MLVAQNLPAAMVNKTIRKTVCIFNLSLGGQTVYFVKRKRIPQKAENGFVAESATLVFLIFLAALDLTNK